MDWGVEFLFLDQEKLWDSLESFWKGKKDLESSVRQAVNYALEHQKEKDNDFYDNICENYINSIGLTGIEQLESYIRDYLVAKNFLVEYLRQVVGEDNQFLVNDLKIHDKDFKKGDFKSLFFRDDRTEYDGFGRNTINKTRKFQKEFNEKLYDEGVCDLMLNLLKERGKGLLLFLEKNMKVDPKVSDEFRSNINDSILYFKSVNN